jgi:hypothetical protein
MGFINMQSFKCLLGKQSKDVIINNGLYSWSVGKKRDFSTSRLLTVDDLPFLDSIVPASFHYMSSDNVAFLKANFKLNRVKNTCVNLDITDLSLSGPAMKNVRYSYNRCSKNQFEICDNFKDIKDVEKMVEEWSNDYTQKYFRDFSGKNTYFYKNDFHKDCINIFIYSGTDLVAFGTLSSPIYGVSTYIIGKALFKRFYGLSEFADIELYKKAQPYGVTKINMGRAQKHLLRYKDKFPGSEHEIEYDGQIDKF